MFIKEIFFVIKSHIYPKYGFFVSNHLYQDRIWFKESKTSKVEKTNQVIFKCSDYYIRGELYYLMHGALSRTHFDDLSSYDFNKVHYKCFIEPECVMVFETKKQAEIAKMLL
jgi:hypothetical protein